MYRIEIYSKIALALLAIYLLKTTSLYLIWQFVLVFFFGFPELNFLQILTFIIIIDILKAIVKTVFETHTI